MLDMDARYSVTGYRGVAFYLTGYATTRTEEEWILDCPDPECDHASEWCYLYNSPEEVTDFDRVIAVMVGDDREHVIDVEDLTVIGEDDYCPGCGQIGCHAYS